jgi:O-antigen ligase
MRFVAFLLSLILVFTIPWENAITVGGIGTLTRAIGLLTVIVWSYSVVVTGTLRKPHLFHILVYCFMIWNILSIFWSIADNETLERILTISQLGILTWILWDLYETPNAMRSALQVYILGAYVAIGSTIYAYLNGQEISIYSGGRYAGANVNAVDLALILILGIPVAWHLAVTGGNGIEGYAQRLVNIAYIPIALFAIILTGTRTAIFAMIPAVLYIVLTTGRLKPFFRILIPAALIGSVFILLPHIPQGSLGRLATTGNSIASGDLGGRVILWNASLAIFLEHPLLGIGAGSLPAPAGLGALAHNTFLSVLVELGPIGFTLFAATVTVVVYQAFRQPRSYSRLWLTVLAIWVIGVFTLSWEFRKPTWLFLSLVVISANLCSEAHQFAFRPGYPAQLVMTPLPAFPQAKGSGANAVGGRGGKVIEVTRLDDDEPGTLLSN